MSESKEQSCCCHQTDKQQPTQEDLESTTEKVPQKANIALPCFKRVILEVGKTYHYCTCGFAKDGATFCDGTCQTNEDIKGWKPKEFTVKTYNSGGYAICCCKRLVVLYTSFQHSRSKIEPFCDGSHIHLDW